jgi:hypothetical protein
MIDRFVHAFNARDLDALKGLFAPGAIGEVVGSGFGIENGPDDIAAKSLRHMLGDGEDPLRAESFTYDAMTWVLFLDRTGALDAAASITTTGDRITTIRYHVVHFSRELLTTIAQARGVTLRV